MVLKDEWFSALAESETGEMIIITGRDEIDSFRLTKKLKERFEIRWKYQPQGGGMPSEEDAKLMEEVEAALRKAVEKDKLAILTGVYTGGGEKTWVFYTRTARVFGERLNEALADFELLPLELYVELDEEWEEYLDLYEMKLDEEDQ